MGLTMAQAVEQRGEQRGIAFGLRAGLDELLTTRFGPVPSRVQTVLDAAGPEVLLDWLRAAAVAETLDEVGICNETGPD